MANNSQKEQVGGETEGFICNICHKQENEGRISKSGMICENCEEEPDLEKWW